MFVYDFVLSGETIPMRHLSPIPPKIERQLAELAEKRKHLLSLPAEKALSTILEEPNGLALVRSFPEEDIYLLIKEIGPEDALPILSLASNRQWQFCIDMEIWDRDRIHPIQFAQWMNLLLTADPDRFIQWVIEEQIQPIEYFLQQHIELFIREHDQDPSDFPDDAITLDGIYYARFRQPVQSASTDEMGSSDIEQFLENFLNHLSEHNDHLTYQNLLLESQWVIPSELEEEAYRLRNVRLAEKGFLPYEEAISIYQPIEPDHIQPRVPLKSPSAPDGIPANPSILVLHNPENHPLDMTMETLKNDPIFSDVLVEMSALANQVAVADKMRIASREDLFVLMKKVRAYLGIGIEIISGKSLTPQTASIVLRRYPISAVFRVGYGKLIRMRQKAETWIKKSWFRKMGLTLGFWTEPGMGTIGGILLPRPKYYDSALAGMVYREFSSLDEIIRTENQLQLWIRMDELMQKLHLTISPKALNRIDREHVTYQSWLLSHYATFKLNRSGEELPLDMNGFKAFFTYLWEESSINTPTRKQLSRIFRKDFIDWLAVFTKTSPSEVVTSIGDLLETLFHDLEMELGSVSINHLDPRFIRLFCIKT
ncbi:DUF6178 family protein [Desulfatirhabdium butyrativorans]|uniref:DUF6178 family protein n=1 Tax=Desulfatirhabdium butyrativorans TaxID=340467 RepID=UPI0003F93E01|nr:DUF6178 family protein [Desulfatirhabdium butyrativorans]